MDPYDFDPYDQDGRRRKRPPTSSRSKTKSTSLSVSIPPHPVIGSPHSFLREKRLQDAASKINFQNTLQHEINTRTYQLRQTLAEINIICMQLNINESYSVDEEVFQHLSVNLNGYFIRKENTVTNKIRMMNIHAFFEEFEKTKALSLRVQNLQPAVRYVHDKVEDKAMVVTAALLTGTAIAKATAATTTSAIATSTEHRNASMTSEYSQTSGRERDHPPLITTTTATASNISINRAAQSTQRLLNALHASKTKTAFDLWNEPKREIPPAKASNHLLPQREIAMRQAMVLESTVAMVKEIEAQMQCIRDNGWNSL